MKKFSVFLLTLFLLISVHASISNAATESLNFCDQYKGVKKIWWNGVELKSGQIGRLTVLKNTSLFKLVGTNKVFSRTLKAGEFYRIYAFKPGMLSVGGGYFVDRDTKVKYETPSKLKLRAAQCVHNPYGSKVNPSVLGATWDVKVTDWLDGYKHYEIQMVDSISDGNVAWQKIQDANMYNSPPIAGKKYVLAKFRIKLFEFEGKTYNSFDVNSALFQAVSKGGAVYDNFIGIVEPEPQLKDIYKGGETEGWVAFLVNADDDPLIVWQRGWEDEIWFAMK